MEDNNKSRNDEKKYQEAYHKRMVEVYKDTETMREVGGKIFDNLDAYFEQDHLSDEDKKLLSELDTIDVSNADMIEFTDADLVYNSTLLGTMSKLKGHVNNVNFAMYTYVINVYTKDPVSSVYRFTRIYETAEPIHEHLTNMFREQTFVHRSNTTCFGDEKYEHVHIELEQRVVKVYDLIVDSSFDIDAPFYFYPSELCLKPWKFNEEFWSTELDPNFHSLCTTSKMLPFKDSSPHKIDAHYMIRNYYIGDTKIYS